MIVAAAAPVGLAMIGIMAVRRFLQYRIRVAQRLAATGSIDDLVAWHIGGIEQWVQMRGASSDLPIALFVHGGPGMPMMPFAHAFQRNWERDFIVVHWDQRNAGKTLAANGVQTDPTLDQHVCDCREVVCSLQARFPGNPIVIVGHSWGTAIAVELLRQNTFACAGYLAIGQVADFLSAERYGFATVLAQARRRGDVKAIKALLQYHGYPNVTPLANAVKTVRNIELKLGFAHHRDPNIMLKLLWLAFQSPHYTWRDLLTFFNFKAQKVSMDLALRELPHFAARVTGTTLHCPILITGGEFDLFTPTPMARALFDSLIAPAKVFEDLAGQAHFGPLEAPAMFDAIIRQDLPALMRYSVSQQEDCA